MRQQEARERSLPWRISAVIAAFLGSMWFLAAHTLIYGFWRMLNASFVPFPHKWDPFPYVMLAMAASVEAIFLSTLILITQTRMQRLADDRAEMDLQVQSPKPRLELPDARSRWNPAAAARPARGVPPVPL